MTAVEWLENEMQKTYAFNQNDFDMFKQAKELEKQQQGYSKEDLKEAFIEGYKQRAEKSDLIFDNASRMYAIHLFEQFKKK